MASSHKTSHDDVIGHVMYDVIACDVTCDDVISCITWPIYIVVCMTSWRHDAVMSSWWCYEVTMTPALMRWHHSPPPPHNGPPRGTLQTTPNRQMTRCCQRHYFPALRFKVAGGRGTQAFWHNMTDLLPNYNVPRGLWCIECLMIYWISRNYNLIIHGKMTNDTFIIQDSCVLG